MCDLKCATLGCFEDQYIIFRNYHSRSSVVRDDEINRTLAKKEEIWEVKNRQICTGIRNTETHFSWFLALPSSS